MPDIRYYEERLCRHGYIGYHESWNDHDRLTEACPGGTRAQITIDWRLGEKTMHRMMEANAEGADWTSEEIVLHVVGDSLGIEWEDLMAIIDAALGRGDTDV